MKVVFFLSGFSFTDTDDSQNSRRREETIFYSFLPLPPAHEHSDIYFATFHVRWLSHIFNRTACIYQTATRWDLPPYQIATWLIDDVMLILVCLLVDLIHGFCCSYLTLETGGLEFASTIILVIQANRLTKCTSHPLIWLLADTVSSEKFSSMTLVFLDTDGPFPGFGESRNLNLRIEFSSTKSGLYVVKVASSETE